jgi:hypothetical protein
MPDCITPQHTSSMRSPILTSKGSPRGTRRACRISTSAPVRGCVYLNSSITASPQSPQVLRSDDPPVTVTVGVSFGVISASRETRILLAAQCGPAKRYIHA